MPIDSQCPHCRKRYKFKDELLGKRVKCSNQSCRLVFEAIVVPVVDAETMAMQALADEPDPIAAIPEDKRSVKMVCSACENKWEVAWALQGKNTICPECRNRQKVPEQKVGKTKIDWRDPKAGRPTLAKTEDVPDDVWGGKKDNVSVSALREAGAIEADEVESRPLKQKIMIYGGALAAVLAVGIGVSMYLRSGRDAENEKYVASALKDAEGMKDQGIPPGSAGPIEATLRTAIGEYYAKIGNPEKTKSAMGQFGQARSMLDATPKGLDRDAALAEWMVAILTLGGDEEQAKGYLKIRWTPQSQGRSKISEKEYSVLEELQTACEIMKRSSDYDNRAAAFRRLSAELIAKGKGELLDALVGTMFKEEEETEARGYLGLEFARTSAGSADAKQIAETLKGNITEQSAAPGSVRALWAVTQTPGTTLPPMSGEVSLNTRTANALSKALEKNTGGAVEDAARPGSLPDKIRALAAVAEFSDDGGAAVARANELLSGEGATKEAIALIPPHVWVRLARFAGKAGRDDAAKAFANASPDEAVKALAMAELVRGKAMANAKQKVDADFADWPEDPKKLHVGHVLARCWLARHNGKATGDTAAVKQYEGWPKGLAKPFGLIGMVLGFQEKS